MEYRPEDQVFAFDSDDVDPAEVYRKMIAEQNAGKVENSTELKVGVKRKFTADNGVNYIWDTEEDCWVVDDEDDGENDSENEDEENDDDDDHDNHHKIQLKYKQAMSEMASSSSASTSRYDDDGELIVQTSNSISKSKPSSSATTTTTTTTANNPDPTTNNTNTNKKKKKSKKKNPKKGPNHWIYITGLPKDITLEEIKSHFSKVGLIALSPIDQTPKIKLYRDEITGQGKGDCSLCYHAFESVEMAINFLDGGYIRPSHLIHVTKAEFDNNKDISSSSTSSSSAAAATNPIQSSIISRRPKVSHAQVKVVKSAVNQALSWNEDDDIGISRNTGKALKIVVLQGMFHPQELIDDPKLLEELEEDIASECSKCGIIEKITIFSQNKNGIIIVKFSTSYGAAECVALMNNRYFGGKQIRCLYWDGVTDYTVAKTAEAVEKEEKHRLDEFGDYLDQQEVDSEFQLQKEQDDSEDDGEDD